MSTCGQVSLRAQEQMAEKITTTRLAKIYGEQRNTSMSCILANGLPFTVKTIIKLKLKLKLHTTIFLL